MKFKEALVMGITCGMTTVDEAIKNIEIHSMNFFAYDEISTELKELYQTWEEYGCPESMPISHALEMCVTRKKNNEYRNN